MKIRPAGLNGNMMVRLTILAGVSCAGMQSEVDGLRLTGGNLSAQHIAVAGDSAGAPPPSLKVLYFGATDGQLTTTAFGRKGSSAHVQVAPQEEAARGGPQRIKYKSTGIWKVDFMGLFSYVFNILSERGARPRMGQILSGIEKYDLNGEFWTHRIPEFAESWRTSHMLEFVPGARTVKAMGMLPQEIVGDDEAGCQGGTTLQEFVGTEDGTRAKHALFIFGPFGKEKSVLGNFQSVVEMARTLGVPPENVRVLMTAADYEVMGEMDWGRRYLKEFGTQIVSFDVRGQAVETFRSEAREIVRTMQATSSSLFLYFEGHAGHNYRGTGVVVGDPVFTRGGRLYRSTEQIFATDFRSEIIVPLQGHDAHILAVFGTCHSHNMLAMLPSEISFEHNTFAHPPQWDRISFGRDAQRYKEGQEALAGEEQKDMDALRVSWDRSREELRRKLAEDAQKAREDCSRGGKCSCKLFGEEVEGCHETGRRQMLRQEKQWWDCCQDLWNEGFYGFLK